MFGLSILNKNFFKIEILSHLKNSTTLEAKNYYCNNNNRCSHQLH